MEVHTKIQRSYNMARIKNKDTRPEIIIRKWLWSNGYRYQLHSKALPGKPDISFPKKRKAIFVNGCFWHLHNCAYFKWPKTNRIFWRTKICSNVKRDQSNYLSLKGLSFDSIVIWECEIKDNISSVHRKLSKFLK
jgi:DNA mismatch endonuclease, patch repair protein